MAESKNQNPQIAAEIDKLVKQVEEWVKSTEGTSKLLQTQKSVKESVENAEKEAGINIELLGKPVSL